MMSNKLENTTKISSELGKEDLETLQSNSQSLPKEIGRASGRERV